MRFDNDEQLYASIGKNIKIYRNKMGLTQQQLSEKSGISMSYLTKLESAKCEKSISISLLNIIANTLDVDITKFLEERE